MATPESLTVDRSFADAVASYRAGNFAASESCCRSILEQQQDHIPSLQILAAIAGQARAVRRGIELMGKVVALRPDLADGQVQLAGLLRLDGRPSEAIAALEKAIALQPDGAAAHNDLGLIHLAEGDAAKALGCFGRAVEISPASAIVHYNKGLAFERMGTLSGAIDAFRRAAALAPDFAEAHAKLGNLLLNEENQNEALACFRRAAAAKPDTGIAAMCEARLQLEEGNAADAETSVRRAIARDWRNSDAHCLLGTILMELGRFPDAASAFDLGIALNRRQLAAYHDLAHVRRLTAADRPFVAQMESMLKERDLADGERADLHFALGKAYDDFGEYDTAIRHFDEGNALKHRHTSYDRERHAAAVDSQVEAFSADFFARNASHGSRCETPILILGMPRSGTTLVEQILSSHGQVAAGGELRFWGEQAPAFRMSDQGEINPAWIQTVERDYRAMLSRISPTALRVTDKRPQNFHYISLIHAVFPRARIIHCCRHPVDTCLSIYFQNFGRRIDFAYSRDDLLACYREYKKLMGHWRSILPSDRFHEIRYEDLVADQEATTRQLIAFCGLDWDDSCLRPDRNRRPVRTASLWQARQPVYRTSVARWQHYEPWLGALRDLLSDADPTITP